MAHYRAALWWRLYWGFKLLLSAVGGTGFIAAAVTAGDGGAITLAVIGTLWLALACLGFNSSRRLAWAVEVAPDTVTLSRPRLRIEIPPREVLEVRAAPWDYTGRGALDLLTANNGLIQLGPARHAADFLTTLAAGEPGYSPAGGPCVLNPHRLPDSGVAPLTRLCRPSRLLLSVRQPPGPDASSRTPSSASTR